MRNKEKISLTSRVLDNLPMVRLKRPTMFKSIIKPVIPLVALLSSQYVYAACQYEVADDWNSGFRALVTITNDTSSDFTDWGVSWAWTDGSTLQNGWNANIDCNGSSCTATGPSYALDVRANQSYTFGFIGTKAVRDVPALSLIHI